MNLTPHYASRIAAARARIEAAYRHREEAEVPFVVADANYWLSGETPSLIPDDYFTDCESMHLFRGLKRQATVVASFISPEMALNEGKYEVISRTGPELAGEVYRVLRRHVER